MGRIRLLHVALLTGLLLAALTPGIAQADWTTLGGALNQSPTGLGAPVISTVAGVPYVAWSESSAGATAQIYVRHWDGTAWVQDGGSLNVNPLDDAQEPTIASVGGVPYVTWEESFQGGASEVQVKHWDGSGWVRDGGTLNLNTAASALTPWIGGVGGVPYVAFEQSGTPSTVDVERFDGTTWRQVGAALNISAGDQARAPSLAVIDGTPYVAWQEAASGVDQIQVDRLSAGAWTQVGGVLNVDPTQSAFHPTIAGVGGVPYVSWTEQTQSGQGRTQAYVKHWDGGAWDRDGGSLDPDPTAGVQDASVADIGGRPTARVTQIAGNYVHIDILAWTGGEWAQAGTVVSPSFQSGAALESLTAVGGVPYAAWAQAPLTGGTVTLDAGALAPGFSSEQAIATDTGALLTARVRDDNEPLPIAFQYGRGATLSTTTAGQITDGTGSATIVEAIGGLSPGTSYTWRAITSDGTHLVAASPAAAFTTQLTGGAGATGPRGPAGPRGATGPQGPAGEIELVVCRAGDVGGSRGHGAAGVHAQKCFAKLVSGPVKFTVATAHAGQLLRAGRLYVRVEALEGHGALRLIVVHGVRRLTRGTYTLRIGRRTRTVEIR
jgi:hypothetical protein